MPCLKKPLFKVNSFTSKSVLPNGFHYGIMRGDKIEVSIGQEIERHIFWVMQDPSRVSNLVVVQFDTKR